MPIRNSLTPQIPWSKGGLNPLTATALACSGSNTSHRQHF